MDSLWDQAQWVAFIPSIPIYIPLNNQPERPQPQPQPQLHTVFPLDGTQSEAQKYTVEDWEAQRLEITRLYENNALYSVMKFMRERHGLDAT